MNLFYPSHDIALAYGVRHFNPPAMAIRLQEDLAYLADIWNEPYLSGSAQVPMPWGWDYDTRAYIHTHYHLPLAMLPTDDDLQQIRTLSSRTVTLRLHEALHQHGIQTPPPPRILTSEKQTFDYIREMDDENRRFVFKTLWSSSGRGLAPSHIAGRDGNFHPVQREALLRHAQTAIRKMGALMAETWIDHKEHDLAMLFLASDTEVRFLGYSLFVNDGTTYRQGYLLSNETIVGRLQLNPDMLQQLSDAYTDILNDLLRPFFGHAWQLGYLGIDMMTYHDTAEDGQTSLRLHPCIELNLRTTMGTICRLWYDKYKQDGVFRISPMLENGHFKAEFLTTE